MKILLKIMREIKLREGSKETMEKLEKAGYLTALVSCGGSNNGFQAIKEKLGSTMFTVIPPSG